MNKAVLALAIFACCLTSNVLSSNMRDSENQERELTSINLGGLIGSLLGNKTITIGNTTFTIPTNNSTSSTPVSNNTSSTPANNSAPVSNNTSSTPVSNNTSSTPANNSAPVSNNTSSTPVTNSTTTPVVNNTQPADSDDSDADSSPTTSTSPTNSTTNTTTPTTPAAPVKYARNDVLMSSFPSDCLFLHNRERGFVGLNNLTWSDSLAASAQAWAENMAVNGFRHSGKTGENIASTTYSTKTLGRLLGLWINEKYHYIPGCTYGHCSTTSAEVGHYTQMVWHSTTQVGCGFAPGVNKDYNYLCCQYYKAGNIIGQEVYPYPVPNNTNTNA